MEGNAISYTRVMINVEGVGRTWHAFLYQSRSGHSLTRTLPVPIRDTGEACDLNGKDLEGAGGKVVNVYARGYARAWVEDVGHECGQPTGRSKLALAPRARTYHGVPKITTW
jgi:hypothetical protein